MRPASSGNGKSTVPINTFCKVCNRNSAQCHINFTWLLQVTIGEVWRFFDNYRGYNTVVGLLWFNLHHCVTKDLFKSHLCSETPPPPDMDPVKLTEMPSRENTTKFWIKNIRPTCISYYISICLIIWQEENLARM